jgi:hypothetical protein
MIFMWLRPVLFWFERDHLIAFYFHLLVSLFIILGPTSQAQIGFSYVHAVLFNSSPNEFAHLGPKLCSSFHLFLFPMFGYRKQEFRFSRSLYRAQIF